MDERWRLITLSGVAFILVVLVGGGGYLSWRHFLQQRFTTQDKDSSASVCPNLCPDLKLNESRGNIVDCAGQLFCQYAYIQAKIEIYCPTNHRIPELDTIFGAYKISDDTKKDLVAAGFVGRISAIGDTKDLKMSPLGELSIDAPDDNSKLELCAHYRLRSNIKEVGPMIPEIMELISLKER